MPYYGADLVKDHANRFIVERTRRNLTFMRNYAKIHNFTARLLLESGLLEY